MRKWVKNKVFRARNCVFGHFLEIGVSGGLDIANYDSTKCFSTYENGNVSCAIDKLCIISIIYAKKEPKRAKNKVLGTSSDFGWLDWSDIMHLVIF